MADFSDIVEAQLTRPIEDLCGLFLDEKAHDEHIYFSGLVNMLSDPADEAMVLAATIELSRCAFLGFSYSVDAQQRIDKILEDAIDLAHTMSASGVN